MEQFTGQQYINGAWVSGAGPHLTTTDPAYGKVVWQGRGSSMDDVAAAVAAAGDGGAVWRRFDVAQRYEALERCRKLMEQRRETLARAIAMETGKPLWEGRNEVASAVAKFAISLKAYQQRCQQLTAEVAGKRCVVRHKPHGVMAVLGPYNFPIHLPHGHIVPALLAGNSVVFKPSEYTCGSAELMVRCWHDAALPAGVVNLVYGGADVGGALVDNGAVQGLLFTGSWKTGVRLQQASLAFPRRIVALEMGGNNPLVVWDSEDQQQAAQIVIESAFLSSGQRCSCARRLIIPTGVAGDNLLNLLCEKMAALTYGPYDQEPEPFMGPLVRKEAASAIIQAYEGLLASGGVRLFPLKEVSARGAFLPPILVDSSAIKHMADEELFGPLLQVRRVATFEDAVAEANDTAYGLAAGLLSDDEGLWEYFYANVNAGIINWNSPLTGASSQAPFGGLGKSGNYRPSAFYSADYCAYPVATMQPGNNNKA